MNKRCSNCYFGNICNSRRLCEHYTTISYEVEELELEDLVKESQYQYYEAWLEYIGEDTSFDLSG